MGHAQVLMMVSARTRAGLLMANDSPVGPPQSWQTSVIRVRSSWRMNAVRLAVCPSRQWACSRCGFSDRPNPIISGTITRRPELEGRDHVAVEEPPGRIAVEQHHGVPFPFIDIVHAPTIDVRVARRMGPSIA